jgi:hypothetical protein
MALCGVLCIGLPALASATTCISGKRFKAKQACFCEERFEEVIAMRGLKGRGFSRAVGAQKEWAFRP